MQTSRHCGSVVPRDVVSCLGDVCAVILKFERDDGVCGCAIDTIVRVRSRLSARPFIPSAGNGNRSDEPKPPAVPSFLPL